MKKRLVSAAVMILIGLPLLLTGGIPFKIFVSLIILACAYELSRLKEKKINVAIFVLVAAYGLTYLFFDKDYILFPVYIIITFYFIIRDKDKLQLDDASIIFTTSTVISIGCKTACTLYDIHQYMMIYVAIASLTCDAGAYFIGKRFGKHKLAPNISPKKTIEGSIGGLIFGFIISFVFASIFDYFAFPMYYIVIMSLILPLISELGDLSFSLIKRYYNVKDYSNLIPGHGGILDRFDSVLFCLLFISIILGLRV